ncbi:translation initiation factor IF-2-like [Manacus candei]|uniref:translation initiation factor IF-2-like n=1 Tax=Manacus candei TaxID=415023 RepID=UPI00222608C9|nr:translation initiation factor IF-2-like [Manacus candei]
MGAAPVPAAPVPRRWPRVPQGAGAGARHGAEVREARLVQGAPSESPGGWRRRGREPGRPGGVGTRGRDCGAPARPARLAREPPGPGAACPGSRRGRCQEPPRQVFKAPAPTPPRPSGRYLPVPRCRSPGVPEPGGAGGAGAAVPSRPSPRRGPGVSAAPRNPPAPARHVGAAQPV